MAGKGTVLISFDVEEFDMPLEYGQSVSLEQQLRTGNQGFEEVMSLLNKQHIPVTHFVTANFADHYPSSIRSIPASHEIASHTYYHSHFKNEDLLHSRVRLQEITGRTVKGLRMPRMRSVEMSEVKKAGFQYDSSVNPTWLPGKYNNLKLPRTIYTQENVVRLPASVSPTFRIPLFWLSFKNFPYSLFLFWTKQVLKSDGYVCLYFHPWEFVDLSAYKMPGYTKRLAGKKLQQRFLQLVNDLKKDYEFATIESYLSSRQLI